MIAETPASTSSAAVSVTAVAPTTVATARLRARPIYWSIGYVTSVCEPQFEPISTAAADAKPSIQALVRPSVNGIANESEGERERGLVIARRASEIELEARR